MSFAHGWRRAFRLSLGKASVERDVDDELAFHLAMREEKLRGLGVPSESAGARAREQFGDAERVREECITIDQRHARGVMLMEWIESVLADFRYAFRTLRRMPAFTIVATLTLALGIGATTAIFTLVNGILLRPLPYPEPGRLVRLIQSYPEKGLDTWGVSPENLAMYRDHGTDFEAFAGYRTANVTFVPAGGGSAERLPGARVTAEFFRAIGVQPSVGRAFAESEDTPGHNNVAIIGYGLWQTRFAGRTSVTQETINIDGQQMPIVGVMPQGFAFPRADTRVWLPMGLDPTRRFGWLNLGLARLKPGISVEHAEKQTTAVMYDWARNSEFIGKQAAPEKTKMKTIVTPLHEVITGRTARPLTVLLAAVCLILLIATANVATLLSSRAATRQREIGLRTALGATGGRVVRQLLTESVALAMLGATGGVALAIGGVRLITHSSIVSLPRIDEVHVDGRVLAFTLAVSVVSGLLFGLLPALHGVRSRLASDLTSGQRESSHRASRRINNTLVVTQLSLSVVLLVAAGLVLKSFQRLTHLDLGFRADGITSVDVAMPSRLNNSALAINAFVATTLDQVRSIPGVQSASLTWSLPFDGNANVDGYRINGRPEPPPGAESQTMQIAVSPGHFATLGIPLKYGRDFTATDDTAHLAVAVVDETMAQRYWVGAEALGKRIRTTGDTAWMTIVGVAGSVRDQDAASVPWPHIYVSLAQWGGSRLSLAVRSAGGAGNIVPAVRRTLAGIDPSIPLDGVRPLASLVDQSLATRRLTQNLLICFALLALVLASIGIYGVMSLHVANRNREFGIRLAIGAEPGALVKMVLGEGALLAALGAVFGVAGALVATRWIRTLLYEVSPSDPGVFASLALALGAIAVAACYVPARRAARSDPLTVLRSD